MDAVAEPRPASTVVLLRDGPSGLETLMLKRNKALLFAGGMWVFPGGALEPQDIDRGGGELERAARLAAAREAREETGLEPDLQQMRLLSHWTTPVVEPKRFATWIYAAPVADDKAVVVDGSEIHEGRWLVIAEALAAHRAGDLGIMPPTFITLSSLARFASVADFLAGERLTPPEVLPVFARHQGQIMVMFPGDAGYASGEPGLPGARHRALLEGSCWHYQREAVPTAHPSLLHG
jgi:8-oxo-dGTP pyrophosphatase MutT (NUDIX family)